MSEEKKQFRNFSSFKKRSDVLKEYDLYFENKHFIKEKKFNANEYFLKKMERRFNKPGVFGSEYSACEAIIYPILEEVSDFNDLPIWSHYKLESESLMLTGEPDYLFAFSERGDDDYQQAIVCVGEAKKENFAQGWAQVSAEMVAAQKLNENSDIPIYGLVTTGILWQFAILEKNKFILHSESLSATEDFQKLLNYLNWLFCEARKNAEKLEKLNKGE